MATWAEITDADVERAAEAMHDHERTSSFANEPEHRKQMLRDLARVALESFVELP